MALSLGKKKPGDETPEAASAVPAQPDAKASGKGKGKGKGKAGGTLVPDTLPIVNLISPSILDKYRQTRLIRNYAFGAVAVVGGVAVLWGLQAAQISAANDALLAAQSETTTIQTEITRLAPVKNLSMEIASQQALATTFGAREVNVSGAFESLNANTPPGVTVANGNVQVVDFSTNPAIASAGAALSPCGDTPNPFSSPTLIGCLRFDGEAPNRSAIGDLLTSLSAADFFYGPYVASTNSIESGVTFTGSVALKTDAFKDPAAGAASLDAAAQAAAAAATAAANAAANTEANADPTAE